MALRRLSVAHSYLRAAVSVRTASWTIQRETILGSEKPICPGNAFTLFLETQPRNGKSLKKYVYEAACKWNTLSQEDKIVFQLKAKELEERYKKEVSEWEIRMQQSGREDLVQRHHQLTVGKNLAIQRSQQPLEDQGQDLMQTIRKEKKSPVMEEKSLPIKEAVKEETSSIRKTLKEEKEALIKGIVKEEESCIKEAEKKESLVQHPKFVSGSKAFRNRHTQRIIIKSKESFS